jgi:hypothetical protein
VSHIDINIINNPSIRMIGSVKTSPCDCKEDGDCPHPKGRPKKGDALKGVVPSTRKYDITSNDEHGNQTGVIWYDIDGNVDQEYTAQHQHDHKQIILDSFVINCALPATPVADDTTIKHKPSNKKRKRGESEVGEVELEVLTSYLATYFPGDKFSPEAITKTGKDARATYYVPLTNKYCVNKLKSHNGCLVTLEVSQKFVLFYVTIHIRQIPSICLFVTPTS